MTGESITAEGLEALKAELHELETAGRQEMSRRIEAEYAMRTAESERLTTGQSRSARR